MIPLKQKSNLDNIWEFQITYLIDFNGFLPYYYKINQIQGDTKHEK